MRQVYIQSGEVPRARHPLACLKSALEVVLPRSEAYLHTPPPPPLGDAVARVFARIRRAYEAYSLPLVLPTNGRGAGAVCCLFKLKLLTK